jgi:hypothetical protein
VAKSQNLGCQEILPGSTSRCKQFCQVSLQIISRGFWKKRKSFKRLALPSVPGQMSFAFLVPSRAVHFPKTVLISLCIRSLNGDSYFINAAKSHEHRGSGSAHAGNLGLPAVCIGHSVFHADLASMLMLVGSGLGPGCTCHSELTILQELVSCAGLPSVFICPLYAMPMLLKTQGLCHSFLLYVGGIMTRLPPLVKLAVADRERLRKLQAR